MKYTLHFLFLLLITAPVFGQRNSKPDPNFHLYLLAGQSNMAGRGVVETIDTTTIQNILVFDKNQQWKKAKEPLHWDKPTIGTGPGFAFGREMAAGAGRKVKIGLIPAAHGGSSITAWVKDGYHDQTKGYPYDEALERVKAALKDGVLMGIIWHQGETDSENPEDEKLHLERLVDLISRFRTEFKAPDLPFVAGELGHYRPEYQSMNKVLNQLPNQVPNTAVISAEGLVHKGDNTHFDSASARELGKRYASAMKGLQNNLKKKK
ncbi:sialate O-acetylesterase [Adhaeribacter aquaticus]|uniref:sialate O-acetylesterase n=1 Tax=Adhaeribacter aquaticus TaxID=299567 RepID=UPI00047C5EA8|nr:sialate O-acetylesterase [Adhaeribacter aquaticus]